MVIFNNSFCKGEAQTPAALFGRIAWPENRLKL